MDSTFRSRLLDGAGPDRVLLRISLVCSSPFLPSLPSGIENETSLIGLPPGGCDEKKARLEGGI